MGDSRGLLVSMLDSDRALALILGQGGHFTLTMPLSQTVYNWVPTNQILSEEVIWGESENPAINLILQKRGY